MNCLTKIATEKGRDYTTPEDVTEAFQTYPEDQVRLDALEILGNGGGVGVEDANLFAFVAWQGKVL